MKGQLRIDEMFAFVCLDDDGTEGIPAIQTPMGPVPLLGADLKRIDSLRPYAENLSKTGKKVTLVKFTNRVELEVFGEMDEGKADLL